MLACPRCRRPTFTRRDLVSTALDGTAQCRACGQPVRLDVFSRWLLSCVIALILPGVLLYGDLFYSGHLFVISLVFVFAAWTALSWVLCPLFTLERATTGRPIDRTTGILILENSSAISLAANSRMPIEIIMCRNCSATRHV